MIRNSLGVLLCLALAGCAGPHERFEGPDDITIRGNAPVSNAPQPQTPRPPMR